MCCTSAPKLHSTLLKGSHLTIACFEYAIWLQYSKFTQIFLFYSNPANWKGAALVVVFATTISTPSGDGPLSSRPLVESTSSRLFEIFNIFLHPIVDLVCSNVVVSSIYSTFNWLKSFQAYWCSGR